MKRIEFSKYKGQSKTEENYMDYNQDTLEGENSNMEPKVFYKSEMGGYPKKW